MALLYILHCTDHLNCTPLTLGVEVHAFRYFFFSSFLGQTFIAVEECLIDEYAVVHFS